MVSFVLTLYQNSSGRSSELVPVVPVVLAREHSVSPSSLDVVWLTNKDVLMTRIELVVGQWILSVRTKGHMLIKWLLQRLLTVMMVRYRFTVLENDVEKEVAPAMVTSNLRVEHIGSKDGQSKGNAYVSAKEISRGFHWSAMYLASNPNKKNYSFFLR
ncbi:hypothetical protein V6N12_037335 [Hibiscus sabdariffa]|uniref:Uncharacterized protein n=1 Tax=Hibiscus sabdariffa TaxID=183260 RepID=A0ABR2C522_9ROSI